MMWLIIIVILVNNNNEEENPVFIYLQYCLNSNRIFIKKSCRSLPLMSARNHFYLSLIGVCVDL